MKVLARKLNFMEASEMVKGTDLGMYRMAWINELDCHPATFALGFDEDENLYIVADDELYVPTGEDILATDWTVIAIEDGESVEEGDDHGAFDQAVVEMLHAYRKMNHTKTNVPRAQLFNQLGQLFCAYMGTEKMAEFVITGELNHDDTCKCPSCEQARFEANPKAFAEAKIDEAMEAFGELLEGFIKEEKKEEKQKPKSKKLDEEDALFDLLLSMMG